MDKKYIYRLFVGETNGWLTQLFRYVIVGGLAFVVDYGLLIILTEIVGLYYLLSATISFMCGLLVNYFISTKWVFRHSKLTNKMLEFTIFGFIGVIGLFINNALLFVFTEYVHIHYAISKLFSAAIVMIWNFFGRKLVLFKSRE